MKILLICINDWANLAYDQCEALRSAGADAQCYKLQSHPFNYENEAPLKTIAGIREKIIECDFINFIHGDIALLNHVSGVLKGKKVAVTYTGSAYRNAPEAHNLAFNPIIDISFTDQCEFFTLGAKNLHYVPAAIRTNLIDKFGHEVKKPYKIGHFPSNPEVKGTKKILQMLNMVQGSFTLLHSEDRVSHPEQFKRMNECDIYIELFKPELNGRPYGCFGVTAFEAAAAGKIVLTQNFNRHIYENIYGHSPFFLCHSEKEFLHTLEGFLNNFIPVQLARVQTEVYQWMNEKHSYPATGLRILNLISQ